MQFILKIIRGLLWSLGCMVGAAICGSLLAMVISYLAGSNPASTNTFVAGLIWMLTAAGAVGGFYLGYTGKYSRGKKTSEDVTPASAIFLVIGLLAVCGIGSCLYLNIKAYQKYGYYVLATDPSIFTQPLSSSSAGIEDRNRALIEDIVSMDNRIDGGDGPARGRLRWYTCVGIDCDEGWEQRSYQ